MVNPLGGWLVLVDVAPVEARNRLDRALRDLGFFEVLPFVYTDRWGRPTLRTLRTRLARAFRGASGRVLALRVGRGEVICLGAMNSSTGSPSR
jgi:hypothetical protein